MTITLYLGTLPILYHFTLECNILINAVSLNYTPKDLNIIEEGDESGCSMMTYQTIILTIKSKS